jgi:hypothetical protein
VPPRGPDRRPGARKRPESALHADVGEMLTLAKKCRRPDGLPMLACVSATAISSGRG